MYTESAFVVNWRSLHSIFCGFFHFFFGSATDDYRITISQPASLSSIIIRFNTF